MEQMNKKEILDILDNAKDERGAVPMRLVRTAFDKLSEPCEDTISRQDAIDEISRWLGYLDDDMIRRIQIGLRRLPSAQPERTCVNCGRTANNGGWYADGRTRCPIEEHYALPKDGFCHLWEKRNVTDDDYPERRTDE